MARTVDISPDEIAVRLIGWTAVAALRRDVRIPRSAVRAVSAEPWRDDGIRLGGTSLSWSEYRQGRFRKRGRRQFLSFEQPDRVVAPDVDRAAVGFDVVVVGVDDPARVAGALRA